MKNQALRRAALLIASLDTDSADALLDEMSTDQAALVRNAVIDLGVIDPLEQQAAIEEFVKRNPKTASFLPQDVEIDPDLARKFSQPGEAATPPLGVVDAAPDASAERPFGFLDKMDAPELARILVDEHPQTTAIVISHLAAARAADVLRHLPCPHQTDVLMRIARLAAPHPEVIRDLEQEMRSLLAHQNVSEQVAAAGIAAVESILQNASTDHRHDLVAELSRQDHSLARQLHLNVSADNAHQLPPDTPAISPPHDGHLRREETPARDPLGSPTRSGRDKGARTILEFTDLENLDNSALAHIIHCSSPNTTLVALAGASHQFVKRILEQLPGREATQLERKIRNIGPIRLDDVQRAQQMLAEIAQCLIDEGTITVPGKQRFAVAA